MRLARPHRSPLGWWTLIALGMAAVAARPQTPASKPAGQSAQKKPPAAPPAPQSKHYPILLIASGNEPGWKLRIGMKGAERLERASYPPIPLDPGTIEQDGTSEAWLYHAKDSQTTADVTVRLSREACSDGMSDTKYSFKAVATHAQIGELRGCARIAPDQFPEFRQKNLDDDDPDKKKVVPPPITNFKPPVAVAYLDPTGRVMVARGEAAKLAAPKGEQLSLSHDGKRLLFTRDGENPVKAIALYDATTGKTTDLLTGAVQSAFWSPDDSQIAFLKQTDQAWHVWTMPASAPDKAAQLSNTAVLALHGWQDVHTVLATDATRLHFLKTESPPSSMDLLDLYGSASQVSSQDALRASPANPDLLVISTNAGGANSLSIAEIKSKRRVALTDKNTPATAAEWSSDGIQVFFTTRDAAKSPSICRIFWDGSGFKRTRAGSNLVIGQ
jgi:uncharacterized membrane protein